MGKLSIFDRDAILFTTVPSGVRKLRVIEDDGGSLVKTLIVGRGYSMRNGIVYVPREKLRWQP